MRVIHKYALPQGGIYHISLPRGFYILKVEMQRGEPCMWVEVNTNGAMCTCEVVRLPTGAAVPDRYFHIGSLLEDNGAYVWHYYAKILEEAL